MLCSNADFFADALGFLRGAPILLRRDRSPPTLPRSACAHHRLRRRFAATIFATPIGLCIILSAAGLPERLPGASHNGDEPIASHATFSDVPSRTCGSRALPARDS